MEIKIEVPEVTLNTVVGDIVRVDEDGDEYLDGQMTVADKVAKLIKDAVVTSPEYTGLKQRVTEIRNQEIREAVKPLVREALERPIRKTNYYGEPTGQETTLSEIIMAEAKKVFTEVKDPYRDKRPFIQAVVADEVKKAFQKDIQEQVQKAREAIATQLGTSVYQDVVKTALEALKGAK
jgi:glutaredoxin 2